MKPSLSLNAKPLNQFEMKLNPFVCLLLSAMLVVILQSCGSSSGDKEKNSEEFTDAEESMKNQIEGLVYNIPKPSEIPYMLQQTGADYNESLLSSRDKADAYMTRSDKAALNLGVYAADIGYLSSYDKTQEAIDYMNTCKTLADNLNIIGTFDASLVNRFEANIANKDSLAHLLNSTMQRTETYLKNDNRNKLAAQVVTGSFIEGLHISTGLVKTYPKDLLPDDARNLVLTPIIQTILKQKSSVSDLHTMLSGIEQTEPVSSIVSDLAQLEQTYNALNIEDQIKNNRADLVLSDKNLVEITNIVERIRNRIIE
jgi:hypothetical protein